MENAAVLVLVGRRGRDPLSRDYDEYELESETGGRVYQAVLRCSF